MLVVALGIIKMPMHPSIFMFYYCNTLNNLGTVVSEVQEDTNTDKAMEELDSDLL